MTAALATIMLALAWLAAGALLWLAWRMRWERDQARARFAELVEHIGAGGTCSDECCMHGSEAQRADTAHAGRPLGYQRRGRSAHRSGNDDPRDA